MKLNELESKKIHIDLPHPFQIDPIDLIDHIHSHTFVDDDYEIDKESIKTYITERYMELIIDDIIGMLNLSIEE